jgi:large subunit ribosomal protein L21
MKYAIIEMCGRQFWFEVEKFYDMSYLPSQTGKKILLNQILFINDENKLYIGDPFLKNAQVQANVLNHFNGCKIVVYKMRSKKKLRRKIGYRQKLTRIFIDNIKTI